MHALDQLNTMDAATFVATLGDIFEHAPWVAEAAAKQRPFATVTALHDAMMHAVRSAEGSRQLAFINGHPELGSKVQRRDITVDSQREQGGLGLDQLSDADNDRKLIRLFFWGPQCGSLHNIFYIAKFATR